MYIGLDIGTSSVKAVLFSETGKELCKANKAYPVHGDGEFSELDPMQVRDATYFVLRKIGNSGLPVRSIGISSLGEAAVLLDADGNVLGNAILPGDPRGHKEAEELKKDIELPVKTGLPINATYTICKLLWMKDNQPEVYSRIYSVMLFGDYIAYCLTGKKGISRSLASRTLAYDINQDQFFSPAEGIDANWFSKPMGADECVGTILPAVAEDVKLSKDIPVFAGGHDQPCAVMGVGALNEGDASDSIGTSECITINMGQTKLSNSTIVKTNYACEPFLKKGHFDTMAYTHTAGRLVEWYLRQVLHREDDSVYEEMNGACTGEPTGLLVLPHLSGSGTPYMDPLSSGAIVGVNLHTDDKAIYQAILESISYEMKQNLVLLQESGIECKRIIAVGGGAKSDVWLQCKADIYQVPICTTKCKDASALGAAICGAKGIGDFFSWEQAVEEMVHYEKVFTPREDKVKLYEAQYTYYSRLYGAIKQVYRKGDKER